MIVLPRVAGLHAMNERSIAQSQPPWLRGYQKIGECVDFFRFFTDWFFCPLEPPVIQAVATSRPDTNLNMPACSPLPGSVSIPSHNLRHTLRGK